LLRQQPNLQHIAAAQNAVYRALDCQLMRNTSLSRKFYVVRRKTARFCRHYRRFIRHDPKLQDWLSLVIYKNPKPFRRPK
jgi:hypothetical protein